MQAAKAGVAQFAVALLLSAALLFCVEPMVAKMIMPMLGGAPAVWITCMVFFQAALLAGYAYAHATTAWLGARRQALLHLVVVCLPLLVLPIRIGTHAEHGAVDPNRPIAFLLWTLVVGVGLPFFVLSTTAPLLQKWFSHVRPDDGDPYFLYGASNLGSMLSLAAYPALIEPRLGLFAQSNAWRWGYCAFVVLVGFCAISVIRIKSETSKSETPEAAAPALESISAIRRLRWIFLSLVPSSMLLSVTTYITTDIAPVPLFWVIPLAIYLATFVLVFAKKPPLPHALMTRLLPLAIAMTTFVLILDGRTPVAFITFVHLATFFLVAMVCHGELAKDRPPPAQLTEFYLWVSVGGVLGGIFNGIVAPTIFDSLVEYPLVLVLACMCRRVPKVEGEKESPRWLTLAIPLGIGALMVGLILLGRALHISHSGLTFRLLIALPIFLNYPFLNTPIRFGLGIGACFIAVSLFDGVLGATVHVERNFFGVVRVTHDESGELVQIAHGTTIHGAQFLDPAKHRIPLTYYTVTGPLGQVFAAFRTKSNGASRRVAVVGLGAGTMAPYRRANEHWTYYEIDPIVISIAKDPRYFTYLTDAFPNGEGLDLIVGDARLELRDAPDQNYDLLVVDAFSSDSIPAHLLTREAIQLYRQKLQHDGLIVVHISNRYLDFEPVFGNLARDSNLTARIRVDADVDPSELNAGKSASEWLVLATDEASLGTLSKDERWVPLRTTNAPVWTDDFSNLLGVFKW
jgi:SAM-dependent methyltransferase